MASTWRKNSWRALIALGLLLVPVPVVVTIRLHRAAVKDSLLPRGPRMVRIPGGTFHPGPPASVDPKALSRTVTLADFEMDETEVTVDQYARCVEDGACKSADTDEAGGDPLVDEAAASEECNYRHRTSRGTHPINCVGVEMAAAFCAWAGKRLPSADEWEYAARGSDGREYPWGNQEPDRTLLNAQGTECLNAQEIGDIRHRPRRTVPWNDGYPLTAPVGTFPKGRSPFGLFDMAGNVLEPVLTGDGLHTAVPMGGSWSIDVQPIWTHYGPGWLATSDDGIRCARTLTPQRAY